MKFKAQTQLNKKCSSVKYSKIKGIPKLDDANDAGKVLLLLLSVKDFDLIYSGSFYLTYVVSFSSECNFTSLKSLYVLHVGNSQERGIQ